MIRIEHVGYMVEDPPQVAAWYVRHLGFRIVRRQDQAPFTHFLVDGAGEGIIEIYNNPVARVPDYAALDPLVLHLAFEMAGESLEAAAGRLVAAGATMAAELTVTPIGDRVIMLRDPWGFAIQLAERRTALRGG